MRHPRYPGLGADGRPLSQSAARAASSQPAPSTTRPTSLSETRSQTPHNLATSPLPSRPEAATPPPEIDSPTDAAREVYWQDQLDEVLAAEDVPAPLSRRASREARTQLLSRVRGWDPDEEELRPRSRYGSQPSTLHKIDRFMQSGYQEVTRETRRFYHQPMSSLVWKIATTAFLLLAYLLLLWVRWLVAVYKYVRGLPWFTILMATLGVSLYFEVQLRPWRQLFQSWYASTTERVTGVRPEEPARAPTPGASRPEGPSDPLMPAEDPLLPGTCPVPPPRHQRPVPPDDLYPNDFQGRPVIEDFVYHGLYGSTPGLIQPDSWVGAVTMQLGRDGAAMVGAYAVKTIAVAAVGYALPAAAPVMALTLAAIKA